jgi:hypothetical protein
MIVVYPCHILRRYPAASIIGTISRCQLGDIAALHFPGWQERLHTVR